MKHWEKKRIKWKTAIFRGNLLELSVFNFCPLWREVRIGILSSTYQRPNTSSTELWWWIFEFLPKSWKRSVCYPKKKTGKNDSSALSCRRIKWPRFSLQSVQARSIWCTDNLQEDHTFHQRSKSAFLSQAGAIEKSECSDQGAWFQSQRAPWHDPLCYRSDSNIIGNFYSNCDVPAPKKHPVVFPQELAIAYNLKCGILNLKNLIQVYDQICPSGDHCLSNKLWLHKNLLLIMCDNQLYAFLMTCFYMWFIHPSLYLPPRIPGSIWDEASRKHS